MEWDEYWVCAIHLVAGFTALTAVLTIIGSHPRHISVLRHPPSWIAGGIGAGVYAGLYCESLIWGLVVIPFALEICQMGSRIAAYIRKTGSNVDRTCAFGEAPISDPKDDLYEHQKRAVRLAEKINSNCGPILLTGRFGSGKSSLTNLIVRELQNSKSDPGWIRVQISGWGLRDPETRAREILSSVCDQISDLIDTVSLRDECRGIVRDVFTEGHWIARLTLGFRRNSFGILTDSIDHLLTVANIRVLLVLEDFERNAQAEDGSYRWHGVVEVIDRLKCAKRIKIIACVTQESVQ